MRYAYNFFFIKNVLVIKYVLSCIWFKLCYCRIKMKHVLESIGNVTSSPFGNKSLNYPLNNEDVDLDSIAMWEGYNTLCTVIVPRLFAFVIFCALVGNLAVICVIIGQKKMRTTLNVFVFNLAISDVMFVSIGLPFVAYRYAAATWELGNAICGLHNYVISTAVYVSVYTMAAVAIFRCRMMTKSNVSSNNLSLNWSVLCILLIWLVMLLANVPILFLYKVKSFGDGYQYCGVNYGNQLFLVFFIFAYALPLFIAVCCNSLIIISLRRQRQQATRQFIKMRNTQQRNARATRLLVAVLVSFALCWLPLHLLLLISFSSYKPANYVTYEVFRVLSFCLAYSSTVVNPIIYNFISPDFRSGFAHIACRACGRCYKLKVPSTPTITNPGTPINIPTYEL